MERYVKGSVDSLECYVKGSFDSLKHYVKCSVYSQKRFVKGVFDSLERYVKGSVDSLEYNVKESVGWLERCVKGCFLCFTQYFVAGWKVVLKGVFRIQIRRIRNILTDPDQYPVPSWYDDMVRGPDPVNKNQP